jgi:hypothetical protein
MLGSFSDRGGSDVLRVSGNEYGQVEGLWYLRSVLCFEHRSQRVVSKNTFVRRMVVSASIGLGITLVSLGAGMWGYHATESMSWIDAFANASMILSGMGPLAQPQTTGGKLFAGFYALYSGLAVVATTGITFAPVVHRFLHRFHAER